MNASVSKFNPSEWFAKVRAEGYQVRAHGCIVTLTKHFGAGNNEGFVECDMMAGGYLAELPQTSAGSVWGTDGGSVGGLSALRTGTFTLNKSGISRRVVSALAKM